MTYLITTTGLMCAHCDATAEAALLRVDGVLDADANHENQTVEVTCDETVDPQALSHAIEGADERFAVVSIRKE